MFSALHHDNNHHLNSLWLWFCSGETASWLLRLPSLLAGSATPLLGACLLRRHGRLEALLGAGLLAGNALLVLMGSEARGYALAVFFCLLALLALERQLRQPCWWAAMGCGLALLLGLLAQLTFLYVWAGIGVWSLWRLGRRHGLGGALAWQLACLYTLPLLGFGLLYWLDLRHLQIGGAEPGDLPGVLLAAASQLLGGPQTGLSAWMFAAFSSCLLLAGMLWLMVRRQSDWLLPLVGMVLAPACVLLVWQPPFMFVRYWTLPIVLGLLLLARVLAALWRQGWSGRVGVLAVLLLVLAGNARQLVRLHAYGRGSYAAALQAIVEASDEEKIVLASDYDFRNQKLIKFHQARIDMRGKELRYLRESAPQRPDWFIRHSHEADARPDKTAWRQGRRFGLYASFPFAWESGCHWWVYRRLERE